MRDEDITVASDGARRGRREGPDCVPEFRGCKEGFDGFVSGPQITQTMEPKNKAPTPSHKVPCGRIWARRREKHQEYGSAEGYNDENYRLHQRYYMLHVLVSMVTSVFLQIGENRRQF